MELNSCAADSITVAAFILFKALTDSIASGGLLLIHWARLEFYTITSSFVLSRLGLEPPPRTTLS